MVRSKIDEPWVPVVLSIIQNESGGEPGILARRKTRLARDIPSRKGGVIRLRRAAGLMQTIPQVINSWSKRNPPGVFWEDVTGKDFNSGNLQIRIGVDLLKRLIPKIKQILPEIPERVGADLREDFVKYTLVSYAWGIGRLQKKIAELRAKGSPVDWNTFQNTYPDLGKPANRPIYYANKVWRKSKGAVDPISPPMIGGVAAMVLVAGLLALTVSLGKG
jgi:hypothetical protein